jgi:hypothetical protein
MVRPSDSVGRGCEESAASLALPLSWVARAGRSILVGIHCLSGHLGFHFSGYGVYQDFTEESSVQTPAVSELSRVNAAFRNSGDTEALS